MAGMTLEGEEDRKRGEEGEKRREWRKEVITEHLLHARPRAGHVRT